MAQNDGQTYKEVLNSPTEKSKRRHAKADALKKKGRGPGKEKFNVETRRRLQHYGEQHPDFHSAQRESKRMKDPWWKK